VPLLPRVIITGTPAVEPRTRQYAFTVANDPCAGEQHQTKRVPATTGWHISGTVADPVAISLTGASAVARIVAQDANGFVIDIDLTNSGTCRSLFGIAWSSDTPASYRGTVTYAEVPVPPAGPATVAEAAAIPHAQLAIPNTTQPIGFSVVLTNGKIVPFAVNNGEIVQKGDQQFLAVDRIVSRVQSTFHH